MPRFLFLPIYSFSLWDEEHAPQGDEGIHLSLTLSYKERGNLEGIFIPQDNISPNPLSFLPIQPRLKYH